MNNGKTNILRVLLFNAGRAYFEKFADLLNSLKIKGLSFDCEWKSLIDFSEADLSGYEICFVCKTAKTDEENIWNKLVSISHRVPTVFLSDSPDRDYENLFSSGFADCINKKDLSRDILEHCIRMQTVKLMAKRKNSVSRSVDTVTNQELRFFLEKSNEGLWLWDLKTKSILLSPSYARIFSCDEKELPSNFDEWSEFVHPDDVAARRQALDDCIAGKTKFYHVKYRLKDNDGIWHWMAGFGYITAFDKEGIPAELTGMNRDITEIVQMDETLKKLSQKLYQHIQNTPLGYIEWNSDGTILEWNTSSEKLFGYTAKEITGTNITKLICGEFPDSALKQILAKSKNPNPVKLKNVNKSGNIIICEWYNTLVKSSSGNYETCSTLIHDITDSERYEKELKSLNLSLEARVNARTQALLDEIQERKKIEKKLSAALKDATIATESKAQFLANMSHEIRTPMSGIIGMAHLLLDTRLNPEQMQYSETIYRSAHALLKIINDILDFSKLEANKLELHKSTFNPGKLMGEVSDILAIKAYEKNIDLIIKCPPRIPELAVGDAGRLRQILLNLLGNAVKFTDRGYVLLSVNATAPDENNQASFLFSVEDTGMGISEEKRQYIFEKFTQVDSSAARKHEGTGLGLAISSELVKLMGGVLNLTSSKTQGSIFYFDIKLPLVEKIVYETNDYPSLSNTRIMLVEKNPMIAEFLSEYFSFWGVPYNWAACIEDAMDLLRKHSGDEKPFNTIIIDQQGDVRTPEEITEMLKWYRTSHDVKMMLLLPLGKKYNSAALKKAGYSAVITKPVRVSELFDNLYEFTQARDINQFGPVLDSPLLERCIHKHKSFTAFNAKILLAEDSAVNQRTAIAIFKKFGCATDVASNGIEVVKMFASEEYDIIFMDCQMPEQDGYEAAKMIRKSKKGKTIPIIAMTANAMPEDRSKCLHAGMNDYIAKPVAFDELEIILFRYCKKVDSITVPRYNSRTTIRDINIIDILDPEQAISAAAYDVELMKDLIEVFNRDIPLQIDSIRQTVEKKDFDILIRLCHKLKGSIATIGGIGLVSLIQEIEKSARSQELKRCMENTDELIEEFEKLKSALSCCDWNEYIK